MKHIRLLTEAQLAKLLAPFCQVEFQVCESAEDAVESFKKNSVDIALLDIDFSQSLNSKGMSGLEASLTLKTLRPDLLTVVISSHESQEVMESAQSEYQVDWYIRRSSNSAFEELAWVCKVALVGKLHRLGLLVEPKFDLITQSSVMKDVLKTVDRVLPDQRVLLQGETGTGKELIAQRLAANARFLTNNPKRHFVALDCTTLSRDLIESELFGHTKGAFTGAISDKIGWLEKANGGDLFLDEIHNLPNSVQVKLLRALNDGVFESVGGKRKIQSTFRIIAATNRNVEQAKAEGLLLPDFVARVMRKYVVLPPLRERREDIALLVAHVLKKHPDFDKEFTCDAIEFLSSQPWTENVRQLISTVERAITDVNIPIVSRAAVAALMVEIPSPSSLVGAEIEGTETQDQLRSLVKDGISRGSNRKSFLETVERIFLEESIDKFRNITDMSKGVGYSRPTLRGRLRKFGLSARVAE